LFEILANKLQVVIKNLKGEGHLKERHLDDALRQVRIALLEADVNFKVVKALCEGIKQKALGQKVLESLTPAQQVVKIVRDELLELLGGEISNLNLKHDRLNTILLVGLQGSGKTTTAAKLGIWLNKKGFKPYLVSADVYRPAAIEQLLTVAEQAELPAFKQEKELKPADICRKALSEAQAMQRNVLILDSAGRWHIDEQRMHELEEMNRILKPQEILYVADAMTGQDAVKSAMTFDQRTHITGVILTKMDGDARGGAALSVKAVTQKPIKFIGVGEKLDALELFHPDRIASRILGMGDVLTLIEKAEEAIDKKEAAELEEKIRRADITLDDFLLQLKQVKKMGALADLVGMIPGLNKFKGLKNMDLDDNKIKWMEAIINSMTMEERLNHTIINGSRRKRIAKGSGTSVVEVNNLLKQFSMTKKLMKELNRYAKGGFIGKHKLPIFG
jgi:signal recognition particle subunit SRP54